jgi:hypothetical protein
MVLADGSPAEPVSGVARCRDHVCIGSEHRYTITG